MNERIQELYRQSHSIRHYDGDPALDGNPPTVYWQDEVSAQRFAKLLIEECVHACVMEKADPRDTVEMECALRIKKYFGVEE